MSKKKDKAMVLMGYVGAANSVLTQGGKAYGEKCYHSHKSLPLGDGLVINGGCAADPQSQTRDVYVSLDISKDHDARGYPWNADKGLFVYFPIRDMNAPENPEEFKKFIDWLAAEVKAGKDVEVGCIGGHGRTGTVFAALVKVLLGEEDAITYVRKHYCKKAVETSSQIEFLHKHFGIKRVGVSEKWGGAEYHPGGGPTLNKQPSYYVESSGGVAMATIAAMTHKGNIWGV